jgi:hypothetical protein
VNDPAFVPPSDFQRRIQGAAIEIAKVAIGCFLGGVFTLAWIDARYVRNDTLANYVEKARIEYALSKDFENLKTRFEEHEQKPNHGVGGSQLATLDTRLAVVETRLAIIQQLLEERRAELRERRGGR